MAKKKSQKAPSIAVAARNGTADPRFPKSLWFTLGAALLVRLAYLFLSRQSPFYEPLLLDPAYYHQWAIKIVRGDLGGECVFYGLPLYPFFLAFFYKISANSLLAVKILQHLLGVGTVYLIYRVGETIGDRKTGLVAAWIAAFYGPIFFHESMLIPEVLSLPLYAAAFWLSCLFWDAPSAKKGAWLGVVFGLAALTKAGIMTFVLLFLAMLFVRGFRDGKKSARAVFACAATFLLTLAPVTLHNLIRGGDLVMLTSHGGFNFYIGNNPKAEGVFAAPEGTGSNVEAQIEDSKAVAEKALGRPLKPSEVSKFWSDKAWQFIRENPVRFLELCLRKLALFFDSREVSDVDSYDFGARFNPFLKFPWPGFAWIGPFFFAGLLALPRRSPDRAVLVWLWVASYLFGMMLFFVNARYRLPLLGVMIPVAAVGALDLLESWQKARWGQAAVLFTAALAGLGLGQIHLFGTDWSQDYVNAGDALAEKKDYETAIDYYQKALKIAPDSAKANLAMGVSLTRFGRYEEAKEYYLKSLAADPASSQAHNNLGLWYDAAGDLDAAEHHFLKAIELKPSSYQAHNNLGMVYGKKGRNEEALGEFEASLKLNPSNPRAHTNLGLVLYRKGLKAEAREHWQKALEIDPRFEEARRALELLERRS